MSVSAHKIAIASRDSKLVYHFGQADRFLIYLVDSTGCHYIETRVAAPACSDEPQEAGHANRIAVAADVISDCQAVLVSRIGPGAEAVLKKRGISAHTVSLFLQDALKQYTDRLKEVGSAPLEPPYI